MISPFVVGSTPIPGSTGKSLYSSNIVEFLWALKKEGHQASLVLRILKGTKKHPIGLANFKRISATFNPYRIGRTAKEREIVFQAAHDLFNDGFKGKEE